MRVWLRKIIRAEGLFSSVYTENMEWKHVLGVVAGCLATVVYFVVRMLGSSHENEDLSVAKDIQEPLRGKYVGATSNYMRACVLGQYSNSKKKNDLHA